MSSQVTEHLPKSSSMRRLAIGSIAFSLLLLAPKFSFAQQGTLTDDATVLIKKNDNHGTDATLRIEAGSGDASNVFVKFKLTSSLPAGTTAADISKATLKLFVGKLHTAGSFDIFRVLSPWSEQDKTVNPSINGSPDVIGIPVSGENQFVVIDVTQLVKDWLNGVLPNNGIALVPSTGSSVDTEFDSKEDKDTSHEPRLEMVLAKGGPGTVTSVTANGPLTVTNPSTTPNISLTGIVPAANGGTGLSTAGASGNLLKSNGSVWTSAPLSALDIPAGSGNYIQNATSQQASSNFNISGNGKANIFDATTQFNLAGSRVLSNTGNANLFVGLGSGFSNTTGGSNSFFGFVAGTSNTTGSDNSFFGQNTGGGNNTGNGNSFFGRGAGASNATGANNSFVGIRAGLGNTVGSNVTVVGANANVAANNLDHATAIGADAVVGSSNTVVLGRGADTVQIPGGLSVAGSTNFGGTLGVTGSANFSGTVSADTVNVATQFNLGGNRVLSTPAFSN